MTTDTRAPRRYALAATGVTILSTLWYLAYATVGAGPPSTGFMAMPVTCALYTGAVFTLVRRRPLEPSARRFWLLQMVGFGLAALGFVGFAGAAARAGRQTDIPVPGAVLIALGLLIAIGAVVRVPRGVRSRADRRKQLLDQAIALLGCGSLLFAFGLRPMITAREPWSLQAVVLVGLSYLFAATAITVVSYHRGGPVDRAALRLIALMGPLGAIVAVLSVEAGDAGALPAQAIVMPLAPLLGIYAVRCQWGSTGRSTPRPGNVWLPYVAVAAVDVPLLVVLPSQPDWADRIVHVAAVVVTGLVALRQFIALTENARLLRDKRASQQRLQHEARHDGLTGLANRALFRQRLTAQLAAREASVLLVDLDDFKTINDSLGHDVGDHLLIAVADVLRTAAGDAGMPVRLGGDEFAVLLTGPPAMGEVVAQRILDAFAGPVSEHHLLVHASIGIATADRGTPLDHLLRDADVAMYAAKQRGKANWVRYHDRMGHPVLTHAQLGGELRRALDADEFTLLYQPVMALHDGRIVGVEPLVRWRHPSRGLVAPAEFIPAAEGTGLIVPLGRFVLREACRQAAAWIAEFGPDALQKVGPNVSVRQLHDPDFLADVRAALADAGLPADRLVLELTESAVLRGPQVSRVLHELHDMGVRLALDDFGTGESSLSLLRAFPAAIIKLDKSFVDGIELDEPDSSAAQARQAVARAVIQLAGALGLDSVAEGIENPEQADRLRRLGYTLGQGFHLARPVPAAEISRMLAAQRTVRAAA